MTSLPEAPEFPRAAAAEQLADPVERKSLPRRILTKAKSVLRSSSKRLSISKGLPAPAPTSTPASPSTAAPAVEPSRVTTTPLQDLDKPLPQIQADSPERVPEPILEAEPEVTPQIAAANTALNTAEDAREPTPQVGLGNVTENVSHKATETTTTPGPAIVVSDLGTGNIPASVPKDMAVGGLKPSAGSGYKSLGVQVIPMSEIFGERARIVHENFGIHIRPHMTRNVEGSALRMEKRPRMRVRRICHECNSSFGRTKECLDCSHSFCDRCTRTPLRLPDNERAALQLRVSARLKALRDGPELKADPRAEDFWEKKPIVITHHHKSPSTKFELKKPRQRVRRSCCSCGTMFQAGTKTCPRCVHNRCTDCPRSPLKRKKFPYGYPGDVFGPKSIPFHRCHECYRVFPGGATEGTPCTKCSHAKCDSCLRMQPQKIDPELDPALLENILARIERMQVE